MNDRPYWLFVSDDYYPGGVLLDFAGAFHSLPEAQDSKFRTWGDERAIVDVQTGRTWVRRKGATQWTLGVLDEDETSTQPTTPDPSTPTDS